MDWYWEIFKTLVSFINLRAFSLFFCCYLLFLFSAVPYLLGTSQNHNFFHRLHSLQPPMKLLWCFFVHHNLINVLAAMIIKFVIERPGLVPWLHFPKADGQIRGTLSFTILMASLNTFYLSLLFNLLITALVGFLYIDNPTNSYLTVPSRLC